MKKIQPDKFNFNKSLKKGPKYPLIHYIRVERYFTRPLASLFVKLVYNTRVTPNQITIFSFILAVAGAFFFAMGTPGSFIAGGILVQFSSVFDCADGMLARSKDLCSRYGAFLDIFVDRIADAFIISSIAYGNYLHTGSILFLILGMLAAVLYNLQIVLFYILKLYREESNLGDSAEARGLLVFFILLASVLNRLDFLIIGLLTQSFFSISHKILFFIKLKSGKDPDIPFY
jgi:CDP-L-myo-inositol myo-inositolphosphotransferase